MAVAVALLTSCAVYTLRFQAGPSGEARLRWTSLKWTLACCTLVLAGYLRLQYSHQLQGSPETAADAAVTRKLEDFALESRYKSRVDFADGSSGIGQLVLTGREGLQSHSIFWDVGGTLAWDGIALERAGILAMATQTYPLQYSRRQDAIGVIIYRINGGHLDGMAVEEGKSWQRRFAESLAGPESLNGRFNIVSSTAPIRPSYIKITAKKGVYLFARIGDDPVTTGIGIRIGDVLAVSYSSNLSPAIVALCQSEAGLVGLRVDAALVVSRVTLTSPRAGARQPQGDSKSECQELVDAARPQ